MAFLDHFSTQAQSYALARPSYPPELFEVLLKLVGAQASVWEAACGSGQATGDLAARFAQVIASEPSAAALALAPAFANVQYVEAAAEHCALASASIDLVVVAQALHWFDLDAFFAQVRRVLRPGGVLAVWCYQDVQLPKDLTAAYARFAEQIHSCWPPQRALVDRAYIDIRWPGIAIPAPEWTLQASWSRARFIAYCRSYSASARYQKINGVDPVDDLAHTLAPLWDEATLKPIHWPMPLFLRRL